MLTLHSLLLLYQGTHMAAVAFLVSWTRLAIFAYQDAPLEAATLVNGRNASKLMQSICVP